MAIDRRNISMTQDSIPQDRMIFVEPEPLGARNPEGGRMGNPDPESMRRTWIDQEIMARAPSVSTHLVEVDRSWQQYHDNHMEQSFRLPFTAEGTYVLRRNTVFVEGWRGELIIDRLIYGEMYYLTTPLRCKDFAIYGEYNRMGEFRSLATKPGFGFHYTGLRYSFYEVCLGDLRVGKPQSKEQLMAECGNLRDSFRCINMHSLGATYFNEPEPEMATKLRRIILGDDGLAHHQKVEAMVDEGYIKPFMITKEVDPCQTKQDKQGTPTSM